MKVNYAAKKWYVTIVCAILAIITAVALLAGCGGEKEKTIKSMQITMPPLQTEYVEGETFDTDGMLISVLYSDGTRGEVTSSQYTIDKTGPLALTDTEVTITYGEFSVKQPISVIALGDKVILTLNNGVDRCDLYADGTLQLHGGGGRLMKPNNSRWSWDGETLEIWIQIVENGVTDEEPTKMDLVYDDFGNLTFKYMLAGRWQMNYQISASELNKALTPDVSYPVKNA